jgi:hypothetical protein
LNLLLLAEDRDAEDVKEVHTDYCQSLHVHYNVTLSVNMSPITFLHHALSPRLARQVSSDYLYDSVRPMFSLVQAMMTQINTDHAL